jgi:putative ABC transport system ATP-binding protein
MSAVLSARHLTKSYPLPGRTLTVLDDVSLDVAEGGTLSIVGPSGSGKTTLLGLCAGLDRPTSGTVTLAGERIDAMSEDERAAVRGRYVGFVFQSFNLLPTLTALENVMVPAELVGASGARARAIELLGQVGLGDRTGHYPSELSGGEQQRVAIARAFVNAPRLLFADEPTGNLDQETAEAVEALLFRLNREQGTALIVVTHDLDLAARCARTVRLRGGRVVEDAPAVAEPA